MLPSRRQVPNSAGGFAWSVDDWTRLRRFLILGSEGGSYYASELELTRKNAQAVERCLAEAETSIARLNADDHAGAVRRAAAGRLVRRDERDTERRVGDARDVH